MAIDTAAKRKSVSSVGFIFAGPGITPDATPDVFWRQTAGYGYGGIETAGSGSGLLTTGSLFIYVNFLTGAH